MYGAISTRRKGEKHLPNCMCNTLSVRWDTSISYEEHTKDNIRTLDSIKHCAQLPKSKPTSVRLGVQNPPILNIEPDHVVADELHLLLRIDVLLRNLVYEIVTTNRKTPSTPSLTDLQKAIHECRVTFRVWEHRDTDGKCSGKYEWTSLMGIDMKTVLRLLPSKFQAIISQRRCENFDGQNLGGKIILDEINVYYTIIKTTGVLPAIPHHNQLGSKGILTLCV